MPDSNSIIELPAWVWLVAYVLAAISSLATLTLSLLRKSPGLGWWSFLRWSLILIVILAVADVRQQSVLGGPQSAYRAWLQLPAVIGGIAVILLLASQETWFASYSWWSRWGRHLVYTGVSLVALLGVQHRFREVVFPSDADALLLKSTVESPRVPEDVPGAYAVTDLGNRIPLQRFVDVAGAQPEAFELPEPYRAKVIPAGGDDSQANCHGWVFTGGRYLIPGVAVDLILHDNHYDIVDEPKAGDVIIYRNFKKDPIHTGLVKAVGQDGFVLIESKWGPLDTFLHLPQDQIYSSEFDYYRSPRSGHLVHMFDPSVDETKSTALHARQDAGADQARDTRRRTPQSSGSTAPRPVSRRMS